MNLRLIPLLAALLFTGALGAQEGAQEARKPTLFLIGDSTVKNSTKGQVGWGSVIGRSFDDAKIRVENRALGGRSSRSYLREGLWDKVLAELKPGDFVVMQFGHNDNGPLDAEKARASIKGNSDEAQEVTIKETGAKETVHSYGWYLRRYIGDAKAKGATAIVCSLVPRNIWKDGKVERAADDFGKWAREAAQRGGAFFIDLNETVARRYDADGQEKVAAEYFTSVDHTHTSQAGAEVNAACVVEGIRGLKDCSLGKYLRPQVPASASAAHAFGLVDQGKVLVVDSGAGLVFKVSKSNGNIVSIRYKGGPELQSKKGSHIASGFGGCAVKSESVGSDIVKVTIVTDPRNVAVKGLTHYLMVRKGQNNIYMATYPTNEPAVGELRWITRLEESLFPNRPAPSNVREATKTIESKDVFGMPDGTTRSKYYGDTATHGKDRAMDLTYCGVSGSGIGVWIVYGTRESSSGGPFHRDIQNQGEEVYNYMNSGHNMTEPARLNVLHGPYALAFTDGQPPSLPLDFSWIDRADLDLMGYVPASQRGTVAGVASGVPAGLRGVVGFSNASAQYWATVGAGGTYASPPMKPGSYEVNLYQGELAVGSGKVTVQPGAKVQLDLSATPVPAALFRIGEWDGTPVEFLNGDKIVTMHPSDMRMSSWGPATFTVGVDPAAKFPALQMRKVNSPTTIKFNLTKEQIADRLLRIGITCDYNRARPVIRVNEWAPRKAPEPVSQPDSRSFTIGTYRGKNATFIYRIPASAFVFGENTLTVTPLSGTGDLGLWLSAGWAYDAIQLDSEPALSPPHSPLGTYRPGKFGVAASTLEHAVPGTTASPRSTKSRSSPPAAEAVESNANLP